MRTYFKHIVHMALWLMPTLLMAADPSMTEAVTASTNTDENFVLGWSSFLENKDLVVMMIISLMMGIFFFRLLIGMLFDFANMIISKRPSFNIDRIISYSLFMIGMHFFIRSMTPYPDQYRFFMIISLVSMAIYGALDYLSYRVFDKKSATEKKHANNRNEGLDVNRGDK